MVKQKRELVPPDEARIHVLILLAKHRPSEPIVASAIAAAAKVNRTTVLRLAYGRNGKPVLGLEAGLAARLSTITYQDVIEASYYRNASGVGRRTGALFWLGYDLARIAREANVSLTQLFGVLYRDVEVVTQELHRRIARYYDQHYLIVDRTSHLSLSTKRRICQSRGWYPPGAWDGNIDDPRAKPDPHVQWYVQIH